MEDVLGMKLDCAKKLLLSEETAWGIKVTSPPNKREEKGPFRIIKKEWDGSRFILTVCRVPDIF